MNYLITGIAAAIMQMLAGIYEVFMVDILDRVGINIGANFNEATLGAVLGSMNSGSSFFDQTFAGIKVFQELLQFSALVLIVLFFIMKMTKSLLGPISNGEHPVEIAIRSSIAMAGAMLSYKIFIMFEYIGNLFFLAFKKTGETAETLAKNTVDSNNSSGVTAELRNQVAGTMGNVSKNGVQFHLVHDLATGGKMFKKMFMADDSWKNIATGLGSAATGAITLIMLISIIALIVVTAKFILEIIERYVLLGVMFYTCPLPFVSLISKNSTIFKSWVYMVLTQIIIMCLNVFFLSMGFIAMDIGWINFVDGAKSISPVDFLLYMFIIISWFLIGTKIDQHIKALGLNTAQTGGGLAGALMGGAFMATTIGTRTAALATAGARKGAAEGLNNKITDKPLQPTGLRQDTQTDDTNKDTGSQTPDGTTTQSRTGLDKSPGRRSKKKKEAKATTKAIKGGSAHAQLTKEPKRLREKQSVDGGDNEQPTPEQPRVGETNRRDPSPRDAAQIVQGFEGRNVNQDGAPTPQNQGGSPQNQIPVDAEQINLAEPANPTPETGGEKLSPQRRINETPADKPQSNIKKFGTLSQKRRQTN